MTLSLPRLLLLAVLVMAAAAAVRVALPADALNLLSLGPRVEYAQAPRGALGIGVNGTFTASEAASLGLDRPTGAVVVQVFKGGAAHAAGIRVEDVIIEFDGKQVSNGQDLAKLIGASRPGTQVPIVLIRGGKRMTLRATIGEPSAQMSAPEPLSKVYPDERDIPEETGFGLQFGEAPGETGGAQRKGARVDALRQGGVAQAAGLRSGDRIVRIDGVEISTAAEAIAALKTSSSDTRRVVIVREYSGGEIEQLVFLKKSAK